MTFTVFMLPLDEPVVNEVVTNHIDRCTFLCILFLLIFSLIFLKSTCYLQKHTQHPWENQPNITKRWFVDVLAAGFHFHRANAKLKSTLNEPEFS